MNKKAMKKKMAKRKMAPEYNPAKGGAGGGPVPAYRGKK
jgi:hypothetical protein